MVFCMFTDLYIFPLLLFQTRLGTTLYTPGTFYLFLRYVVSNRKEPSWMLLPLIGKRFSQKYRLRKLSLSLWKHSNPLSLNWREADTAIVFINYFLLGILYCEHRWNLVYWLVTIIAVILSILLYPFDLVCFVIHDYYLHTSTSNSWYSLCYMFCNLNTLLRETFNLSEALFLLRK